jgi:Coenzyme PQQ synthesis protein D (PqqD)
MNNSQVPVARKEGLVIQEMPDEVLVYDLDTNKAHCLNQTAAFVWKSCDGRNSVAEITKLVGANSGSAVPEDLVWLAIDQLSEKNLLANNLKANFNGSTRREVIKKIGLAAVIGIPIVASLTAPTSVLAATSCTCTTITDCQAQPTCPQVSCTGGVCR